MKRLSALVVTLVLLAFPFASTNTAYAAPGSADLNAQLFIGFQGAVILGGICNSGDEDVVGFTLNIDSTTNYDVTSLLVHPDPASGGSSAVDPGSIDSNTGVWTGRVTNGQCVVIIIYGDVTGAIGDQVEASITVSDSLLDGPVANVDPNPGNDTGTLTPYEITALPDVAIQTRLLTEGEITVGSNVSYEVIYNNVGAGAIPVDQEIANVISFIVPDEASFDSVEDLDLTDELSFDPGNCFSIGPPSNLGPGMVGVPGTVVICILTRSGAIEPGTSYPFKFNMTATQGFVSEGVVVYANASGSDLDTLIMQQALFSGENPFEILTGVNNVAALTYNNEALTPLVSLCPGQGALTTDGNGCFRISFNKLIWEPSFEIGDLQISAGQISSLTKINDFTWEIRIINIPAGQSAILTLTEGSVLDYSAVASTQVLGENVIRFEVAGNAAGAGATLPETGSDLHWSIGLILLLLGSAIAVGTKRKAPLS